MARFKLTPAERMLVSIAETERQQAEQQTSAIYTARIQSLLDTHGIGLKENWHVTQDGNDLVLEVAEAPVPLPAPNV